jgi:hypothetical protein
LSSSELELSGHHEIVIVEHQSARNAVFVKLEANGVSRRLLVVFRFLALVEIADRAPLARDGGELLVTGRGIVVLTLVGSDLADLVDGRAAIVGHAADRVRARFGDAGDQGTSFRVDERKLSTQPRRG